MNLRKIIAIGLLSIVILIIVPPAIKTLWYPPGTVTETFRQKMFELVMVMVGALIRELAGDDRIIGKKKDELPEPPKAKDENETIT